MKVKTRPPKKLTIVSIWYRGRRHAFSLECEMVNGKAKITESQLKNMCDFAGVLPGTTYSIGA